MRIAAVLVTHDRPELLTKAIAALKQQTRPLDGLFVVDNASQEPTRALLAAMQGLTVLRLDTNTGGAGGFALGLAHALATEYDWIWLLDDDAIARPDALAQLLAALDGPAAGAGALCGAVREFGRVAPAHRRRYLRWCGIEIPVRLAAYRRAAVRVDTASFVGFLVAASAIAEVGLPEAAFFLAYDDTEYSLRLGRAGMAIWLIPNSVVEHLRSAQGRLRAGPFGRKHYFNIRNRIVVAMRYGTVPVLPACVAALTGLAVWLASAGRLRRGGLTIFRRALADGMAGRVGGYPAALAQLDTQQARALEPPVQAGKTP
ncbi:MAG: glycosyltransferase [Pseudomonadota bacterium]